MLALLNRTAYRLHDIIASGWTDIGQADKSRATFVDGGNSSIIKTPAAELQRIRTAAVATENNKLAEAVQKEGYLLVKLELDDAGKIRCKAELKESTLELGSDDLSGIAYETAGTGENTSALVKFCETARRLAEMNAAQNAVMRKRSKFIVLDGTLEAFNAAEMRAIRELMAAAADKNIIIGSVAKTCSLLTDAGKPLLEAVEGVSGKNEGYIIVAEGLSERHNATVAVARLNSSANYIFRIEAANKAELLQLIPALKEQSNDLAFPGYPYGLIMADRFARISEQDAELTKAKIRATAAADVKALLKDEKALDANSVLDSM